MNSLLFRTAIGCWILLVVAVQPQGQVIAGEQSLDAEPSGGLIVNLAADGLAEFGRFDGKLDKNTSKESILQSLHEMIDEYADTQVSHLFLNTNYQRACFPSKVWDSYWDVEDPDTQTSDWRRCAWLIHRHDIDLYAECIEHARHRGMSPWVSMRMNDTHYTDDPNAANTFWQEHPEYRCKHLPGFDFSFEAVRTHHLALVEELLDRYDVDGIELDWMRFANQHFNRGKGETYRRHLTTMMHSVRRLAEQASQRRGHPVQVAVRVPALPGVALGFGIDAVVWTQEGLVDLLTLSQQWRPVDTDVPVEVWRKRIGAIDHPYTLAVATDIWVFGAPDGPMMLNELESMRGFTASMLDRGADQIYLFNHFNLNDFGHAIPRPDGGTDHTNEHRAILSQAGRLETVLDKPRRHVLSYHDLPPSGVQPALPAALEAGKSAKFRIHIGPRPSQGQVVVRVGLAEQASGEVSQPLFAVTLNGKACREMEDLNLQSKGSYPRGRLDEIVPRVVQFEAPLDTVRRGYNKVRVTLSKGEAQKIVWMEIYIEP